MLLLGCLKAKRVYFQRCHGVQPDTKVIIICWGDYMYVDRLWQERDWVGFLMYLKSIQALKVKCVIPATPWGIEISLLKVLYNPIASPLPNRQHCLKLVPLVEQGIDILDPRGLSLDGQHVNYTIWAQKASLLTSIQKQSCILLNTFLLTQVFVTGCCLLQVEQLSLRRMGILTDSALQ